MKTGVPAGTKYGSRMSVRIFSAVTSPPLQSAEQAPDNDDAYDVRRVVPDIPAAGDDTQWRLADADVSEGASISIASIWLRGIITSSTVMLSRSKRLSRMLVFLRHVIAGFEHQRAQFLGRELGRVGVRLVSGGRSRAAPARKD